MNNYCADRRRKEQHTPVTNPTMASQEYYHQQQPYGQQPYGYPPQPAPAYVPLLAMCYVMRLLGCDFFSLHRETGSKVDTFVRSTGLARIAKKGDTRSAKDKEHTN